MPDKDVFFSLPDNESTTPAIEDPGLAPAKNTGLPIINDGLEILCGPLLNYKGMQIAKSKVPVWHGSVLIVARPGTAHPVLKLECRGPQTQMSQSSSSLTNEIDDVDNVRKELKPISPEAWHAGDISGVKLYADPVKVFWRFAMNITLLDYEAHWQYVLTSVRLSGSKLPPCTFVVPSVSQSMRIMFYSCNGFSEGTEEDECSGPALWNDALRVHAQRPFHAMIGGGDQIYNDGVTFDGPLKAWTEIGNPKKRRDYPFDETLRAACDSYYFSNYVSTFLE